MKPTLRYAVVFFVGILVGLAVGAWGLRAMWHHGPPTPEKIVKMLDHRLHFTDEQKSKALVILTEETSKMKALRQGVGGQFEKLRDQGADRMRAILDPKQQATYDEMKKRFDRHRPCLPPPPMNGPAASPEDLKK